MSSAQTIRLSDFDVFGFDIDHTIAKYCIPHLFDISYKALATYLVEEKGYSDDLLEPFDPDFCTRGLVFDTETGNLLKLAENGTVIKASHGTKFLSDTEIEEYYGEEKHWKHFEELIDCVNNIGDRFRIFENFFDIPGNLLCARLVDIFDKEQKADNNEIKKYTFFQDVLDAYNDAYHSRQFDRNMGRYFPVFKSETEKFLKKCSQELKNWLKGLKEANKKTFIMTSSFVDFASHTMEYVIGPEWKDYFDYFLFLARKPSFFSKDRYFLRLDGISECEPIMELKEGQFVSQGNQKTFMKSLSKATGKEDPKVVYFGDSLRSDIFPAKKHAGWHTVMILEEMDAEMGTLFPETCDLADSEISGQSDSKRIKLMGPDQLEKEYLTSKQWGSLFTYEDMIPDDSNEKGLRKMNTLWGYVIRKYADVSIPCLEAITDFPLELELPVFCHDKPRHWGFHPRIPVALQGVMMVKRHDQPSNDVRDNQSGSS